MENDGLRMLMELDAKVASLDVGSLFRGVEAARKLAVGFETALGKVYSAAPAARLAMDGWSEATQQGISRDEARPRRMESAGTVCRIRLSCRDWTRDGQIWDEVRPGGTRPRHAAPRTVPEAL